MAGWSARFVNVSMSRLMAAWSGSLARRLTGGSATYRHGGFEALVPQPRVVDPRTPPGLLELAFAFKRERMERTAAQVQGGHACRGRARAGVTDVADAISRAQGLNVRADGRSPGKVYGRFEASARNELWTGDGLHGPKLDGAGARRAVLLAFIDDHSRLLVGWRWGTGEDVFRLEAALRSGLMARGVPEAILVDRGSAFVSSQLLRACAVLGVKLIHASPRAASTKGKIERFFRTVRDQFLVEIDDGVELAELNRLFSAWLEVVYHRRVHSETEQTPLERFDAAGAPGLPTPALLREAFLWSEERTVAKTATVSLHGNEYEVDAALVGRKVELDLRPVRLDPDRGALPAPAVRDGSTARDRPAHPSAGPARAPAATNTDRDRLPQAARRTSATPSWAASRSTTQASPNPTR